MIGLWLKSIDTYRAIFGSTVIAISIFVTKLVTVIFSSSVWNTLKKLHINVSLGLRKDLTVRYVKQLHIIMA